MKSGNWLRGKNPRIGCCISIRSRRPRCSWRACGPTGLTRPIPICTRSRPSRMIRRRWRRPVTTGASSRSSRRTWVSGRRIDVRRSLYRRVGYPVSARHYYRRSSPPPNTPARRLRTGLRRRVDVTGAPAILRPASGAVIAMSTPRSPPLGVRAPVRSAPHRDRPRARLRTVSQS
jgi:hypothetical protein